MCLEHQKPGTREDTVPPSLEVLAQHLQETYTVTSVIRENGTATITFVHANKRGEASRVEYPNVPLARAVELGNLAVQHLMRHPKASQSMLLLEPMRLSRLPKLVHCAEQQVTQINK